MVHNIKTTKTLYLFFQSEPNLIILIIFLFQITIKTQTHIIYYVNKTNGYENYINDS